MLFIRQHALLLSPFEQLRLLFLAITIAQVGCETNGRRIIHLSHIFLARRRSIYTRFQPREAKPVAIEREAPAARWKQLQAQIPALLVLHSAPLTECIAKQGLIALVVVAVGGQEREGGRGGELQGVEGGHGSLLVDSRLAEKAESTSFQHIIHTHVETRRAAEVETGIRFLSGLQLVAAKRIAYSRQPDLYLWNFPAYISAITLHGHCVSLVPISWQAMQPVALPSFEGQAIQPRIPFAEGVKTAQCPSTEAQSGGSPTEKVLLVGGIMTPEPLSTPLNLCHLGRLADRKLMTHHQSLPKRHLIVANGQTFYPVHIFQEKMCRIVIIPFMNRLCKGFSSIFFSHKSH